MRPPICWSDLPGRKVGIYGLGTEGQASLRACHARGIEPVLVADSGEGVLLTAEGGLQALLACDVVIKSPGISRYSDEVVVLETAGVAVVGGLGMWLQEADRSRVLTITGTKGKSTTTAITGHLLTQWGYRVLIGGNIGLPPFDPAVGSDYDYWIIELSSYQASDLSCSTPVVALTSLSPDHLPWHQNDPEIYYRDKLSGTSQPGADLTVANGDSLLIRERASLLGPRVQWISIEPPDDSVLSTTPDVVEGTESSEWMTPLGLLGSHNRRNALIARACLVAMGVPQATDEAALRRAAAGFAGLDSRLKLVGTVNGVDFVDDNLSTNVLPTLAAVEAFPDRRVALIVGGQSRGIEYGSLGLGLQTRQEPLLMLTVPDNGPAIGEQVAAVGAGPAVTIVDTAGLIDAVRQGYEWAGPGGVVLLSPAAPSFGIFQDYKERGAVFVQAMNNL